MSFTANVKKYKHVLINALIAIVFFAGGYFTHTYVASTQASAGFPGNGNFAGPNGTMPTMGRTGTNGTVPSGVRATSGTIVSNSGSYITIKLVNGSTKNVYIGDSTTVYSRTKTTADQLTANKTVTVQGDTNSDNSIQGTTITIE